MKQNLQEIVKLRNELLRVTILKENQILLVKNRNSSSTENISDINDPHNHHNHHNHQINTNSTTSSRRSRIDGNIHSSVDGGSNSGSSSSSDWQRDSGLASQKSDSLSDSSSSSSSNNCQKVAATAIILNGNNGKKSSFIPRPISMSISSYSPIKNNTPSTPHQVKIRSSSMNSNTSKVADLTYKNYAREQLIQLIQEIENENSIIKRQLESKSYLKIFNFILKFIFFK